MTLKTLSGNPIFPIGIGTWLMGGDWDADAKIPTAIYDDDQTHIDAIKYCVRKGQNHIDTAEMYGAGHTDEIVGEAIKDLAREDLFIADKLWKDSFGENETREAVQTMLKSLGTEYIDLLYIHSPFDSNEWEKSIKPINDLIDEGIIKHFGVSNFSVENMKRAKELSKHPIVANQMLYNCAYKDEVDANFVKYCKDNNILIVSYRPIDRGILLDNKTIIEIAEKHSATPAQVCIAWLLQRDAVTIPKASNIKHIDENFEASNIKLDNDDLEKLDRL